VSDLDLFDAYLRRWRALPAGEPVETHSGFLLPVDLSGRPAMIKIARHIDERVGGRVMAWWDGQGAARIYAHDEDAGVLLMERATGSGDLLGMARDGADDQASGIVCRTLDLLHAKRSSPVPEDLLPLTRFFDSLAPMARREGGLMAECAAMADELLASQRESVVLHGDAHHSNILDFGDRGWLAIDPKRVIGERYYDYVNVLCNPDLETCVEPARFARQVDIVVASASLDRSRLLRWVMAHAALSAAWFLEDEDHDSAHNELEVARLAQHALG
jgi:streptomycin 6-kinase